MPQDRVCRSIVLRTMTSLTEASVLTMMVTNAVLGGIADTVAQSITAIRLKAVRKPGGIREDDLLAIEIHELDKNNPLHSGDLIPNSKLLPPPFDFERLARFMGYGFFMAPIQLKWFQFLSRIFPISKETAFAPAMKRVAFDQLVFAPAGMYCYSHESPLLKLIYYTRYCFLLHSHDSRRGWRTTCYFQQTPGYVSTYAESQFHGLASSTNTKLPCITHSVSSGE
jgi:hypothetical protein